MADPTDDDLLDDEDAEGADGDERPKPRARAGSRARDDRGGARAGASAPAGSRVRATASTTAADDEEQDDDHGDEEEDEDDDREDDKDDEHDEHDERGLGARTAPDREPPRSTRPERPSQPPRSDSEPRRDRRESLFRETLRRAVEKSVEAGVETFTKADSAFRGVDSAFRGVVDEVKLPKEFANIFFNQVDETKNAVVRVVAREVREFLDATDIADEFYRALTSLSFEIKTEIRFIPNDQGGVRPDVRAKVAPRRDKRERDKDKKEDGDKGRDREKGRARDED